MSKMGSIFKKVAEGKIREKNPRLEAGEYPKLIVSKHFMFEGMGDAPTAIVEVIVAENSPTAEFPNPAPVGSKRSVVFTFGDKYGYGHGRLKAFAVDLLGPPALTDEQLAAALEGLFGEDARTNPEMRGKFIGATGMFQRKGGEIVKGKDGTPIVNYTWRFIAQDENSIKAEKAKLDAAGL